MTRRNLLALLSTPALRLPGQGVSSRGVKPMPRGKPSGLPFNAHFTDVAEKAGLRAAGHLRRRRPQEVHPRNHGLRRGLPRLRQRRLAGHLPAHRHALRRRARRRHQPPLQEQPRRHLHRRHREGRPAPHRLGLAASPSATTTTTASTTSSSPTGARTSSTATTATAPSPTSPKRPACCTDRAAGAPAAPSSTTTATATSTCSSPTTWSSISSHVPAPGQNRNCNWKGVPVNCGPRGLPPGTPAALPQQRRRHLHRRQPRRPASPSRQAATA